MKHFNTITAITVGRKDENIVYGDCTRVRLEDECGGLFLVLQQHGLPDEDRQNEIRIELDEWDSICQAVLTLKNQQLVK